MTTFANLEVDKFYLVKIKDGEEVTMIQVAMETEKCVLVCEFGEDFETTLWKKKEDTILEIVEELTEQHLDEYEAVLLDEWDSEDEDYIQDEDDEDDDKKKKKKKKK